MTIMKRNLPTIVLCLFALGCISTGTPGTNAPAVLVDFECGPIQAYNKACKRCHGIEGANFAGNFNRQSYKKVREVTEAMMRGPAYLKPSEPEFEAMTSYMLAIQRNEPYAIITNAASFANGTDSVLKGEVSPGFTVVIAKDGNSLPTEKTGKLTWQIDGAHEPPFDVKIEKNGRQGTFTYPQRQWIQQ